MENNNLEEAINVMRQRVAEINGLANQTVHRINESMGLAHSSNGTAIRAFEAATQASTQAQETITTLNALRDELIRAQNARTEINNQIQEFNRVITQSLENIGEQAHVEFLRNHHTHDRENRIHAAQARIQEMQRLGIFEYQEQMRAQAQIDATITTWQQVKELISDPKFLLKVVGCSLIAALGIYIIKCTIPMIINSLTQPRVISETSTSNSLWFNKPIDARDFKTLIFNPFLHEQLNKLISRVGAAKFYNEKLPHVLLHGPPGTGKTAFVRALAHAVNLDYVITSGSEFIKLNNLNQALDELRYLFEWACNTDEGLIVFFDECESLFIHRRLPKESSFTQDFINTFLSLIHDKSHEKIMFIFATNHPFKLDDAITSRIGINIEFTLPKTLDRARILLMYLEKFSKQQEDSPIRINAAVIENMSLYAQKLDNFSPRDLKFVAEEMIAAARREKNQEITKCIAKTIIHHAQENLIRIKQWEEERNIWLENQKLRIHLL